jgi:hypothetical protein
MSGKMSYYKNFAIIYILIFANFTSNAHGQGKSLKEIYEAGKIRFIPEFTIDETFLPEDTFFESAFNIKCDKDGCVYVCDYRAHNIKIFDSSGKFIKTIGREGQGPGEFNRPYDIAITDERLIVWNMGNRRLDALNKDGELIKSASISIYEGWPQMMRVLPNGDVVIASERISLGQPDKPQDYFIDIYSPDLEKKKRFYTQQIWRNKYVKKGDRAINVPLPFSPRVYWDVSPTGEIVIGYSKAYEIEIYGIDGEKISSFSHTYTAEKITNEDKKKFFASIGSFSGGEMKQGADDFIVKNTEFPKIKPAFQQIKMDSEGNVLVMGYRKNRAEEARYFDAFDIQGNFLGNVQILSKMGFPYYSVIRNRTFWLPKTDEEGLIKIIKYRISE